MHIFASSDPNHSSADSNSSLNHSRSKYYTVSILIKHFTLYQYKHLSKLASTHVGFVIQIGIDCTKYKTKSQDNFGGVASEIQV